MGYMNYYLNDQDIIEKRKYEPTGIGWASEKHDSLVYTCPYCSQVFLEKENLFDHIKKTHNLTRPVVLINDKVISKDEIFYFHNIDSINIEFFDNKRIVLINSELYEFFEINTLAKVISTIFNKKNEINFAVNGDYYFIKRFSVDAINYSKINDIIFDWSAKTDKSIPINQNYKVELNAVESKYLDGIFNYFLACTSSGVNKTNRYMDAYGLLSAFNPIDSLALFILKIICYKFNWFKSLRSYCYNDDEFTTLCNFISESTTQPYIQSNQQRSSIFVEDVLVEDIKAFYLFSVGNKEKTDEYLSKYQYNNIADKCHLNRVLLLNSLRMVDKKKKYRGYYNDITEPMFNDIIDKYVKRG